MLAGGQPLVEFYQCMVEQCLQRYPADAARAYAIARWYAESVGSVYDRHHAAPLDDNTFLFQVMEDQAALHAGPPASPSGGLYPESLPRQFFADPARFLNMCERIGSRSLDILWDTTEGCEDPLPSGQAHMGRLQDDRRYLVLRMPPPAFRFEAHFVAMVSEGQGSPARMFAMERGTTPDESVLAECYTDGRLRLGAAGPAESKNFIRLVRQQLALSAP